MNERKIVGAIITGGRIYKAGDETAFAARMEGRSLDRLIDGGQLVGDWTGASVAGSDDSADSENEDAARKTASKTPASSKNKGK